MSITDEEPPALMTIEHLKALLEEGIPESRAAVRDLTGTMDHFAVDVVSPVFEGKSLIEQHKIVHAAVGKYLTNEIHALQIRTTTP